MEFQKRTETDFTDLKKKSDNERLTFEKKIEQLTKEKDNASSEKVKNEKAAKEISEEKAKMEKEYKELLQNERVELND